MNWNELRIHTTNEVIEAVSNVLLEHDAGGVSIEDSNELYIDRESKFGELYELNALKYPKEGVYIKAYFIDNAAWPAKKERIIARLHELENYDLKIDYMHIDESVVQEADWENEWKKYFKPAKVTDRFVIVPSWEVYDKAADDLIITIDPGMAFGTGTHATTILSLAALEEKVQQDDIVLDVGSGSGILSIGAALLGSKHVYAYDLDEVAVTSSAKNCELNNLTAKVTVEQKDLLKGVKQEADVIVSNILAEILVHLIDDAWDNLKTEGYFITSGIIESKYAMIKTAIEAKGFIIEKVNRMDNWVSIIAKK